MNNAMFPEIVNKCGFLIFATLFSRHEVVCSPNGKIPGKSLLLWSSNGKLISKS